LLDHFVVGGDHERGLRNRNRRIASSVEIVVSGKRWSKSSIIIWRDNLDGNCASIWMRSSSRVE
jgi:hypothetical protein